MAIIGVSGVAKSGKDTFGKLIQVATTDIIFPDWLSVEERIQYIPDGGNKVNWKIKKFAGKLKTIAEILTGIQESNWDDQVFKDCRLPMWDMTAREFMQKLGTEAIRVGLHDNAWVNALMSDYDVRTCNWVITDVRFPNEASAIKNKGGIVVRINKPGIKAFNSHISENAMSEWQFDYTIDNNGDINDLYKKALDLVSSMN